MSTAATWQDTASAVGTLLAVGVALGVAIVEIVRSAKASKKREKAERLATAGLVSAWVDEQYLPNTDGSAYIRQVLVNLANGANEPVFRVTASIGVGWETRSIGPLAVPAPIPVLPAHRTLSWDITLPLRAHDDTQSPCVEMGFSDSSDRRWLRRFDGSLVETTGTTSRLVDNEDMGRAEGQIGRGDIGNPMAVAISFLNLLAEDPRDIDVLRMMLAPEAPGWADLDEMALTRLKEDLSDYGLGGYVSYPAPHVAYVKILAPAATHQVVQGGDPVTVQATIITLTYVPERGWRVFSYGRATEADRILFPEGSLFLI